MLVNLFKFFVYALIGLALLIGVVLGIYQYTINSTANEKWFSALYPSFHLKIIDQNGNPVEKARIIYTNGRNSWLFSKRSFGEIYTPENGAVEFFLDGREFGIIGINREGYHIDYRPQLRQVGSDSGRVLSATNLKQFHDEKPLVIKAWKLDEFPQSYSVNLSAKLQNNEPQKINLMQNINTHCLKRSPILCRRRDKDTKRMGEIRKEINRQVATGKPYQIRAYVGRDVEIYSQLLEEEANKKKKVKVDPDISGNIQFKISKINDENDHRLSMGWSLSIHVPSGGIAETNDLYLYEAPVEGYQPDWKIDIKRNFPDEYREGFHGGTYKFYVMLNNGQYFGRLYVDIKPFNRDYSALRFESFINKSGDTNLNTPLRYTGSDQRGMKNYFNYE